MEAIRLYFEILYVIVFNAEMSCSVMESSYLSYASIGY